VEPRPASFCRGRQEPVPARRMIVSLLNTTCVAPPAPQSWQSQRTLESWLINDFRCGIVKERLRNTTSKHSTCCEFKHVLRFSSVPTVDHFRVSERSMGYLDNIDDGPMAPISGYPVTLKAQSHPLLRAKIYDPETLINIGVLRGRVLGVFCFLALVACIPSTKKTCFGPLSLQIP